jgi:hypothetical protein
MTSMAGKLSLVIAAAGGLGLMALSPTPLEAGVIHQNLTLAAPTGNTDVMRVRCERSLSNLWSCNDDVRVQGRRDVQARDRYAYQPCDHSYETARDGSRCGNRAADRRAGGR